MLALVLLLVLAPWWRNHAYLRSFFDYGVVMGGIGRIHEGQRPYVDFVSPIQTGWYVLNGLAERAGGGTFTAMTLSGVACILVSLAALLVLLTRRWPWPVAVVVAGCLVAATATQHTLIWYNSWGVVLVAVVAWAGAMAPVLRRSDWMWHLLAGLALFLGGINKINMQWMALGLAAAWAVRAGLTGRADWARVGRTLCYYLGWAILPVWAEMAWTGASFATWWHNVIGLPAANRSGMMLAALSPDFLLKPVHDYYGPLLLEKGGLICTVATGLTVAAILRHTWNTAGWLEKILPVASGAVALLGGVVLMTTNMDIAYIGLAGWLALLIALWLGYELPARGKWFYGAIVAPVVLVGAAAWLSAWQGQRSQFGHSQEHRADYVDGAQAGPEFAYFRGTLMPAETVESLRRVARWRQSLSVDDRRGHFYGPGTEWAARIWPAMRTPGLPIYVHAGNSLGQAESERLFATIIGGELSGITVSHVLDFWSDRDSIYLLHRYARQPLGQMFAVYQKVTGGVSSLPVWFTRAFGGNADARFLVSGAPFQDRREWHKFIGVTSGTAEMKLTVPTNRIDGQVVLRRQPGAPRLVAAADFKIFAEADATNSLERWSQHVELPADQDEILMPYSIDCSSLPVRFTVTIPPALNGIAAAGWRGPMIQHTGRDGPDAPAWFSRGESPVVRLDEAALARLLPEGWRPESAFMHDGRVNAEGIELAPGGEIWLRVRGLVKEFLGTARMTGPAGYRPMVRGIWYNSGRLDVQTESLIRENDQMTDIRSWCAEPGGWLVIALDPGQAHASATVRIHKVTHQDSP
jgi:hypothetical protein